MMSSPITTHILDTSVGRPAAGVKVRLERKLQVSESVSWDTIGDGQTNDDGRVQ